MTKNTRSTFLVIFVFMLISPIVISACGNTTPSTSESVDLEMASMTGMPDEVKSAPTTVQQAYQFAAANPDVLKKIPCYCGCGKIGHTSNYSCYVQGSDENGAITYDPHALGCSICVDITQDTMRLMKQGMSVADIKAKVDQTYAQYGPSTNPQE